MNHEIKGEWVVSISDFEDNGYSLGKLDDKAVTEFFNGLQEMIDKLVHNALDDFLSSVVSGEVSVPLGELGNVTFQNDVAEIE
jgi:hypothetical protein